QPFSGINHYRLKMTDLAGGVNYSNVVNALVKENGGFAITAYPNPVNDVLTVRIAGARSSDATISVSDAMGRVVKSSAVTSEKHEISLKGLAAGIYIVKYADAKQMQTINVTKN
ncbi:MAG TPA: T9SS type A sorting domain-containing protein, partial [Flavipsychrobacter sp.]|nr:T9SS type A sorting domain-containing protein [Flavipsychrobacter sp.]